MSIHVPGSSHHYSPSANVQGWVEVSERGVGAMFGIAVLSLMVWGFGYATAKAAIAALATMAEPAVASLMSADNSALLWAVADGLAIGLFVLLLRRVWHARDSWKYRTGPKGVAVAAPTLAAGIAAGLLALALNIGALPTVMSASDADMSHGIPALLEAAHFIGVVAGGGAGGEGPYPELVAGWAALLAALVVMAAGAALIGGIVGGGLVAVGLGAVSGAVEGATVGAGEKPRGGALAGAIKGAKSGAWIGALAALMATHLAAQLARDQEWGPFILFDVVGAVATAIILLLCRRTWSNESGLIGNSIEAGKVLLLLLQLAIGLAIVGAVLGGGLYGLSWLLS